MTTRSNSAWPLMADNDPNELLLTARRALRELRARNPLEESDAAIDLADAVAQLDQQLQAGGALPTEWQPPLRHDTEGRWVERARAQHRLKLVIDLALRDDERADRALGASDLRNHLVHLLAGAIMRELEEEQEQVKAMLAAMARNQTARIAEAVAEVESRPLRTEVDRDTANRLLRQQGPTGALPPHLRRREP